MCCRNHAIIMITIISVSQQLSDWAAPPQTSKINKTLESILSRQCGACFNLPHSSPQPKARGIQTKHYCLNGYTTRTWLMTRQNTVSTHCHGLHCNMFHYGDCLIRWRKSTGSWSWDFSNSHTYLRGSAQSRGVWGSWGGVAQALEASTWVKNDVWRCYF